MKALCWHDTGDVRIEQVPDPKILNPRDAIIRVTATSICGSDLHLYNGFVATLLKGDILGHEFMGEVVEVGSAVTNLRPGDRVVVPFTIACGNCFFCQEELYSLCDNANPNGHLAQKIAGAPLGAIFGYSHLFGGYAGGQAEYVRVPYADVGPLKVPDTLSDEQVLFLSDIFPTGWMAAENCGIRPGETVAVWGCGPVGQMAIRCLFLLGAGRVIAIDRFPERLEMARQAGAQTLNYEETDVLEELRELTGGLGPDACLDAVGMEAHGHHTLPYLYDRAKQALQLETGRPIVVREMIYACRKGGTLSLGGAYAGVADKIPLGLAFNKGLTIRMGQTHMQRYMEPLLERIERGEIDPSFVITHRMPLDEAPEAYRMFRDKEDNCIKVVLKP